MGDDRGRELQERRLADGPPQGSRWRHYKGGTYVVAGNVVLEDPPTHLVIYRSEQLGYEWARPLAVWREEVAPGVPRFAQIE